MLRPWAILAQGPPEPRPAPSSLLLRMWGWVCLRRAMAAQNTSGCRAGHEHRSERAVARLPRPRSAGLRRARPPLPPQGVGWRTRWYQCGAGTRARAIINQAARTRPRALATTAWTSPHPRARRFGWPGTRPRCTSGCMAAVPTAAGKRRLGIAPSTTSGPVEPWPVRLA